MQLSVAFVHGGQWGWCMISHRLEPWESRGSPREQLILELFLCYWISCLNSSKSPAIAWLPSCSVVLCGGHEGRPRAYCGVLNGCGFVVLQLGLDTESSSLQIRIQEAESWTLNPWLLRSHASSLPCGLRLTFTLTAEREVPFICVTSCAQI